MAFTRVVGPGIHTQANIDSHNIHSTGIITATKFDGPFDSLTISGNLSIGGTCLLYTSPSPRDRG